MNLNLLFNSLDEGKVIFTELRAQSPKRSVKMPAEIEIKLNIGAEALQKLLASRL